jgi:hypothetical protein
MCQEPRKMIGRSWWEHVGAHGQFGDRGIVRPVDLAGAIRRPNVFLQTRGRCENEKL